MTSLPDTSGGKGDERVGADVANTYYASWYAAHKMELADKRKQRYREDPKYRQEVLDRSKKRYQKLRQEKLSERAKNPEPPRTRGRNKPQTKVIGGVKVDLFSVSEFADRVDRNVQTITKWEQDRIIPLPTHIDEYGRRWYSDDHMDTVASTALEFRARGGRRLEDFQVLIEEAFVARG